jgi:hypothetical protein
MLAMFRQAINSTLPDNGIITAERTAGPASVDGAVLMLTRDSGWIVSSWPLFSAGYARSRSEDSAARRALACSTVIPGFRRPAIVSAAFDRSARRRPFLSKRASLTTASNTPSGNHRSGASSAVVPVKPFGATPTTVKSRVLTRIVRPTNAGSNPASCQIA